MRKVVARLPFGKMWSRVILCLFVGLAYANHSPAWDVGKEYFYNVHGRTLALLSDKSNEYSGIVVNATLRVQPVSDGKILCQIQDAIYSQILSQLPHWKVPATKEWRWKPLDMFSKPFEVEYHNGVITDLIVSKDTPNWEVNMIKSIVSQFQLNTKGENIIESSTNIHPKRGKPSATYTTMEQTVTGNTETQYSINQLPRYVLQSNPKWAKHLEHYNPEEAVYEIVKTKDYSNHIEFPAYVHGLGNLYFQDGKNNQYGGILSRECLSNVLVTGNMDHFIVHTSTTTEIVATKPLLAGKGKSSVVSYMHVHLNELRERTDKIEPVPKPLRTGNLVYSYAISNSNPKVRSAEESYKLEPSPLDQPPQNPLLPFNIGYKGMSIKNKIDIVRQVVERCQKIGNDIEDTSRSIRAYVLNYFTTLVPLVRLMDAEEMKQAFNQLYTTKREGREYASWVAFRDLVAESGTGPALLNIKDWLLSGKIDSSEAGDLLSTIARSVRQPTEEFMRTFFELIKSPSVQEEKYLNRTALISYAVLIRKVYVVPSSRKDIQYASESFGDFSTASGRNFVENSVIPYFAQQLHKAISQADTDKIHTYIRCLGSTGHRMMIPAFEPYLEGDKRCSQFQRLLMVLSLERIVRGSPELGIPIMYKIYRNVGEQQEIRIAAAYQILRAFKLPSDVLKSMAMYTNIDQHEHVNAAIISGIKSFADLKQGLSTLIQASRAAKPFLNQKTYGSQYGSKKVIEYISKQLQDSYIANFETITSESESYPKNVDYNLYYGIGGIIKKALSFEGSISSLDELLHQLVRQTQWYGDQKNKKGQQEDSQQWTSENVAKELNITTREREQLEGFLYASVNGYFRSISFNNRSLDYLPEAVRFIEEQLKEGQEFNIIKFRNWENMKVAFPTAMGVPFLYTYNQPSLFRAQGHIKASANPQIYGENKLNVPRTLSLKADTNVAFASSHQGILSFTTPFDHQQYLCGFERLFKSHVPIRGGFDVDLSNMRMKMQLEPKFVDGESQLFHHSTWPVTSRLDLLNFQSIPKELKTRVWRSENMRAYEETFGVKQTGAALRVRIEKDRKYMDLGRVSSILWEEGPLDAMVASYHMDEIHHSRMDIYLSPEHSTSNRIVLQAGYKQDNRDESDNDWTFKNSNESDKMSHRLQKAMENVVENMKTGKVTAYDISAGFEGSRSTHYISTFAFAKTWTYPENISFLMTLKRSSDRSDVEPFEFIVKSESSSHNVHLLDMEKTMTVTPKLESKLDIKFVGGEGDVSEVRGDIEFTRSADRTHYIKSHPTYKQCQREMEEGNKYLQSCLATRDYANQLNDINMKLHIEELAPGGRQVIQDLKKLISRFYHPNIKVTVSKSDDISKDWSILARFDPDLKAVNVSAKSEDEQIKMNNILVNDYVRQLLVPSTYVRAGERLLGAAMGRDVYRPICVISKSRVSNFNNVTFPADLSRDWTVMFQYIPLQGRQDEDRQPVYDQLRSQLSNYVILVRKNGNSGKDVKIVFSSKETAYENVEIDLTIDGKLPKVSVNGQEMVPNTGYRKMYNGSLKVRRHPAGELAVLLPDRFVMVYDGQIVRIMLKDYMFRNSARGICGQLNQEPLKDFLAPQDCITRDSKKFIRSYELGHTGKQTRQQLSERSEECVPQHEYMYADYISDREAQRTSSGKYVSECTGFQTQYVEEFSDICFTIHPMPICNDGCHPESSVTKRVAVHCIPNNPSAKTWKTYIDNGANPDFSRKPMTKTLSMRLPKKCVQ